MRDETEKRFVEYFMITTGCNLGNGALKIRVPWHGAWVSCHIANRDHFYVFNRCGNAAAGGAGIIVDAHAPGEWFFLVNFNQNNDRTA